MSLLRISQGLLLAAVGLFLVYGLQALPPRGALDLPPALHVSPRFIEQGLEETGTPNLVSAVLADYRSFDTLGETLVIFTAGLACCFIMGGTLKKGKTQKDIP